MTSSAKGNEPKGASRRATTALLAVWSILAIGGPATSFAASDTSSDCDRLGRDLQSLAVETDSLATEIVDLAVGSDPAAIAGKFDAPPADTGSQAPMLYLAPRLDSIVRDVFDAVAIDGDSAQPAPQKPTSDLEAEVAHPPLADSATEPHDDGAEQQQVPPRFQRQMYRTDI